MIPAMIKIKNNMEENINVNLTFQDSYGSCDIPEYPIASKTNSSQPVPFLVFFPYYGLMSSYLEVDALSLPLLPQD